MSDSIIINLENIHKSYDTSSPDLQKTPVLNDLSLTIHEGESVVITGPSGSGKSTLLNIIGTLDRVDSGKVELSGQIVNELSDRELAMIRLRKIGFVFQLHHLLPQCTILENVLLPTLPVNSGNHPENACEYGISLLERLGLKQKMNQHPGQLSGGERQRVAVARALINRPGILLADEPSGSLDRQTAEDLARLLMKLNQEDGITLVVVTHSSQLESHMGKSYKLIDGKLE